eukprot:Colp12_sorted_trinity150504_noHs@6025
MGNTSSAPTSRVTFERDDAMDSEQHENVAPVHFNLKISEKVLESFGLPTQRDPYEYESNEKDSKSDDKHTKAENTYSQESSEPTIPPAILAPTAGWVGNQIISVPVPSQPSEPKQDFNKENVNALLEKAHQEGFAQGREEMAAAKERELQAKMREWRMDRLNEQAALEDKRVAETNTYLRALSDKYRHAEQRPVCWEEAQSVMQCYKAHGRDSLQCSERVQQFVACANTARKAYLANVKP